MQPNRMPSSRLSAAAEYLPALCIGLLAVWYALPVATLAGAGLFAAPVGDLPTNLIGHLAYQAPGWHWPLLRAPGLAWPNGKSIAMTDSNPLLSIVAKIIASFRGKPENLFGLWLAACLVLQPLAAIYALRGLARLTGLNAIVAAAGAAALSLLLPELLFRVIHINLLGQFILLAALGMAARDCRALRATPFGAAFGVLAVAMLIHPYLFIFGALTLTAPLFQLSLAGGPGAREGLRHWGLAILFVAGLFILLNGGTGGGGPGFGLYSMDLLGPVWPQKSGLFGADLPIFNATGFQHEGFNYLGAGVVTVITLAGIVAAFGLSPERLAPLSRRYGGLAIMLAGLSALAVTPHVTAGGHVIAPIGTAWLERPFAIVRASGRAFWVVAYALMLGSIGFLGGRLKPLVFAAVILAVVALQWTDSGPLRHAAIAYFAGAGETAPDLSIPADTWLYRTVPVCGADSVVADEYRLLALRHGAVLADARIAHDPPDDVCGAMLSQGLNTPMQSGETRLFFPAARTKLQVTALGPLVTCVDSPPGLMCHCPLRFMAPNSAAGIAGQ